MAKIKFNNKEFQIDDATLAPSTASLKSHLSTVMNGAGAIINLGDTAYSVDSAKLTTATNDFVSHLNTIAGNGSKVVIGGVEYGVDSGKIASAFSELQTAFDNLASGGGSTPEEERLEGDGQKFYKMAPSTLSFRSTAPLNELQDIQIDGVTVDPANYTLEEGSTIVKLSHEYLQTLDVGSYELSVVSDSKTVKGGFNVAAPELNEYGFYYDQPYYGHLNMMSGMLYGECASSILFHQDGTANIYQIDSSNSYDTTFTYENNTLTFEFFSDQFEGTHIFSGGFSDDGNAISGEITFTGAGWFGDDNGVFTDIAFNIDTERITCDDVYVYYCSADAWEYFPKSDTLANYPAAKTNIWNLPVDTIAYEAFMDFENIESITIPDSVTCIRMEAFGSSSLSSVVIPSSVNDLQANAFSDCTNLMDIRFEGTASQWNAIEKDDTWNYNVPATFVQCSDGQIAL